MSTDPHSVVAEAFRSTAGFLGEVRAESGLRRSLVFVSAGAAKSTVVANPPLAIAEGCWRVPAMDAADGHLATLLVPGSRTAEGFEQVLAVVTRLNLIESDIVGYIYKCAPRPPHSAGTGVMVSPVEPLARPTWTPRSRPPACPSRVVMAFGVVVRSPFGPPRSQHRGLA